MSDELRFYLEGSFQMFKSFAEEFKARNACGPRPLEIGVEGAG